jgi:hypothetical protein
MNSKSIFKRRVMAVVLAGTAGWAGLAAAPALAAGIDAQIPLSGMVTGSQETVSFSGVARINSRLAPDPDFNLPQLILTVDLAGIPGVGSTTTAKYVISGPEIIQRRLAASHTVQFTFPFAPANGDIFSTRSGVASFALDFDQNTGAVIQGSGTVGSPGL